MNQKAKPTKGPTRYVRGVGVGSTLCKSSRVDICVTLGGVNSPSQEDANGAFIATAFNSATACESLGFDGQKAIEKLPQIILAILEGCTCHGDKPCNYCETTAWLEVQKQQPTIATGFFACGVCKAPLPDGSTSCDVCGASDDDE